MSQREGRDADALQTLTTRPNTSQTTRALDGLGNPTLVHEAFNGAEYVYEYDAFGNLTRDAEHALQALRLGYCAFHRSNLYYC